MDRVGARNALIVLLTVVALTVASVATLLILVGQQKPVPQLLLGIVTTFVGFLTGTQVSFDAKPRADAAQKAASDAVFDVKQAIGSAVATTVLPAVEQTFMGSPQAIPTPTDLTDATGHSVDLAEHLDDTIPAGATDAPDTPVTDHSDAVFPV